MLNNPSHYLAILILWSENFDNVNPEISPGLRIFNGQPAKPGDYPYVVAIGRVIPKSDPVDYKLQCTGSIIASTWTLTAGHCIQGVQDDLSANKTNKPVIRYFSGSWTLKIIKEALSHPSYKISAIMYGNIRHDIGLLRTEDTIDAVGKVSAVDIATLYGHKVIAAGHGRTSKNDKQYPLNRTLRVLEAIVIKCSNDNMISDMKPSFCLAWSCNNPTATCAGDSGGPVIHSSGIIGVNAGGTNHFCSFNTSIHYAGWETPTSRYIDWIARHIHRK